MTRSIWKGPFVDPNLIKKVNLQREKSSKNPIKSERIIIMIKNEKRFKMGFSRR